MTGAGMDAARRTDPVLMLERERCLRCLEEAALTGGGLPLAAEYIAAGMFSDVRRCARCAAPLADTPTGLVSRAKHCLSCNVTLSKVRAGKMTGKLRRRKDRG